MRSAATVSDAAVEARAFAQSVAGALDRHARPQRGAPAQAAWAPGDAAAPPQPELIAALNELGWEMLAQDRDLVGCAGLGAVELGRRLAPLHVVDGLLPGSPMAAELVRSPRPDGLVAARHASGVVVRRVVRAEPAASSEGLEVLRVVELEDLHDIPAENWGAAAAAWTAAGVGYLAGVGEGALDITVGYVRQRRAFGSTLGALTAVQQLLAEAATAVRGVSLLAGEHATGDALAHAGHAVAEACAACQQVTGAIGFTLEYPLHRYTQRARALAVWNDALLDLVIGVAADQPSAIAR